MNVLQPWVTELTLMQQSVLIAAVRGPDTLHKNHIAKFLCRWLRRCFLYSAFEKKIFMDPHERGGGSFTGPCHFDTMEEIVDIYLRSVDEIPHHFQLHLMHAAEILGYKHPDAKIRAWWHWVYKRIVNDVHLNIETEAQMDHRLGDVETQWRASEEVTAWDHPVFGDET